MAMFEVSDCTDDPVFVFNVNTLAPSHAKHVLAMGRAPIVWQWRTSSTSMTTSASFT